jgi:hypothetical protein
LKEREHYEDIGDRLEDNIKMALNETVWRVADWMYLA